MSVVYRALDPGICRYVAVKVLLPLGGDDANSNRRFLQEVRTLGKIRHANVVQIFDFGELDGRPYIVMECLEGEDLARAITGGRCGDVAWKLDVARQLAGALDHVHNAGIIHRDIKPANVFIERSGVVKLMDFGIARAGQPKASHATVLIGTPGYLTPEQVRGESATQLSDIYSYGVLLYELFSGKKPFSGNTAELLYKIVHEDIPLDVLRNAGLPKALISLIRRATDKSPIQRPSGFRQILSELAALASQPEQPRFAWSGRKIAAVAALLATAVLATVLIVPSIHQRPLVVVLPSVNAPGPVKPFEPSAPQPPPLVEKPRLRSAAPSSAKPAAPGPTQPPVKPPNSPPPNDKNSETPPETGPAAPLPTTATEAPKPDTPVLTRETPSTPVPSQPAPTPTQPADNPGSRNPVPQVAPHAAASVKIHKLLRNYAAAFGSKDLNAVAALRDLTAEQRKLISDTFSQNLRMEMTIMPFSELRFEDSNPGSAADPEPRKAVIIIDVIIRLRTNNGEVPPPARPRVTVGFTRIGDIWRISSWE